MNKRKNKIGFIIIFIIISVVIILVVSSLTNKDFNPISLIVGDDKDVVTENDVFVNYNGIYRYRESLNNSYKLFNNCTVSYYDYYIVVLNADYYRYKSSCIGTFLLDQGNTKDLKISYLTEKNKKIIYDGIDYIKNDNILAIEAGNYYKNNLATNNMLVADNYKFLFKEVQKPESYFSINNATFVSSNASFNFKFSIEDDNSFVISLVDGNNKLYSNNVKRIDDLPLLSGVGDKMTIIEPIENSSMYSYTFKVLSHDGFVYNLEDKFPITIDGDYLTVDNSSIYVKFSRKDNAFVMLVGDDKKFCTTDSDSKAVASYVFHIKYNYVEKNFDNPKFIKKIYKNEECKYVNDLMEG